MKNKKPGGKKMSVMMSKTMGLTGESVTPYRKQVNIKGAAGDWTPIPDARVRERGNTQRHLKMSCPSCGAIMRASAGKLENWLRGRGLPICPDCNVRFETEFWRERDTQPQVESPELEAAKADDPATEKVNRIRMLREKVLTYKQVLEPNDPKIKQAEAELFKELDGI